MAKFFLTLVVLNFLVLVVTVDGEGSGERYNLTELLEKYNDIFQRVDEQQKSIDQLKSEVEELLGKAHTTGNGGTNGTDTSSAHLNSTLTTSVVMATATSIIPSPTNGPVHLPTNATKNATKNPTKSTDGDTNGGTDGDTNGGTDGDTDDSDNGSNTIFGLVIAIVTLIACGALLYVVYQYRYQIRGWIMNKEEQLQDSLHGRATSTHSSGGGSNGRKYHLLPHTINDDLHND